MTSRFHDAHLKRDPCDNLDCADCHPDTWNDDHPADNPWWWPWAVAGLLAGAAAAGVVIQTGRPGP